MNKCITHYENVGDFISNINGNWRNSVYITCSVCTYEKKECCGDLLVSFDSDGNPVLITINDANYIFATVADKSECLCEMSNAKFICIFDNFIKSHTSQDKGCPLLQLIQKRGINET